jgi:hypothetical protein
MLQEGACARHRSRAPCTAGASSLGCSPVICCLGGVLGCTIRLFLVLLVLALSSAARLGDGLARGPLHLRPRPHWLV